MKQIFFILTAFLILLSTCSKKEEDDKYLKIIRKNDSIGFIAKPIVQMLKDSLFAELSAAIKSSGPLGAIDICNASALKITEAVSEKSKYQVEIKRVSRKFRNPANSPDSTDLKILQSYETDFANGTNPPSHISFQVLENNKPVNYFYSPLKIQPICLNCHGDPVTMDKELVSKLKQLYPQDKATGYKEGDFRGLVRVKILGKK
jgi:hypothetical protein